MIQRVNLYTQEFQHASQKLAATTLLGVALVVLVGVAALGGWYRYQAGVMEADVADAQAANDRLLEAVNLLGEQVQMRRPDSALESALERVTNTLSRRQRLLDRVERLASSQAEGFATPMSALARQVPDGLWLSRIVLRQDQVSLQGATRQGSLVPVYLERLGEEPAFKGQVFGRFELNRGDDSPWIEFRVATRRDGEESE